ncbi:hypothetical protein TrRE_jg6181 [Triparma retinervis]|uniref:EamA domain-containing protein n=1 Tax=Triparma retinervis TaxID=2557542 RepID=A0A9W7G856_9STRA|nr:hypothetical protein TrRE_jg6181 [Triparma retinervis]
MTDLPPSTPTMSTPLLTAEDLLREPEGTSLLTSIVIVSFYLLTWVGQSEYAQDITTDYNHPGFICYLNHSILVLMFPLVAICLKLKGGKTFSEHLESWRGTYTWREVAWVYSIVAVEYAVCIWSWVLGLTMISVSSSNALYQLQCVFTVWFACLFLGEKMDRRKWLGCTVAFVGIVGVVLPPYFQDSDDESSKFDSIMETMTTLGMIGIANAVAVVPLLFVLHFSGQEKFGMPESSDVGARLFVNACLSFIFDLSFALAIYLTNPVIVSISSALVIPLSFLADNLLHSMQINYFSIGATPMVLVGLFILNKDEDDDEDGVEDYMLFGDGEEDVESSSPQRKNRD